MQLDDNHNSVKVMVCVQNNQNGSSIQLNDNHNSKMVMVCVGDNQNGSGMQLNDNHNSKIVVAKECKYGNADHYFCGFLERKP